MKVVIYMSGISPTGAPWTMCAHANSAIDRKDAREHVARLSKGAPVAEVAVDVPEYFLVAPPPPVPVELEPGPVVEVAP